MADRSTPPVRSWIVRITIGSFSLAALMGVVALLGGGEFGETEARVLLTTLLVGTVSVHVLCYLATADRPFELVGVVGGVVVLAPLLTALYMIWAGFDSDPPEAVVKTFGVGAIVAATLAQACLLMVVGTRRSRLVGRLLAATLVMAGALACLTSAIVLGVEPDGFGYARVLGIVAILDVLGTVVVAALGKFGGPEPGASASQLVVPPDLAARIASRAAASGQTPDDLLRAALDAQLSTPAAPRTPSR
jgi:hypothetical protein